VQGKREYSLTLRRYTEEEGSLLFLLTCVREGNDKVPNKK
jgi:hypothetical protein